MKGNKFDTSQTAYLYQVFTYFCKGEMSLIPTQFWKLCRFTKIYPKVIGFEELKRIIMKQNVEEDGGLGWNHNTAENDATRLNLDFNSFLQALHLIAKIGFK